MFPEVYEMFGKKKSTLKCESIGRAYRFRVSLQLIHQVQQPKERQAHDKDNSI